MTRSAWLHVASWNVENLAGYLGDPPRHVTLADVTRALGSPDVLCLQELQLRPRDEEVVRLAVAALPDYAFAHALADDPQNAKFRGGRTYGVGTFFRRGAGFAPLARSAWDREGRMVTVVSQELSLAIVNVYAVNGTNKPHWDHELGRISGDRHGWKRRFHEHVAEHGETLRSAGLDLVMIGDWNVSQARIDITPRLRTEEPHATSRAHFADTVVRRLDLVDVFRALHPEERAYTWFSRRARGALDAARVDFALLSRTRLPDVTDASIDQAAERRFGSDHAPLHLTLRRSGLRHGR